MVLAPFFLALGALGGGLFVASPCVMRVVVLGAAAASLCVCGPRRLRAAAFVRAGASGAAVWRQSVWGVCAGPA